MNNNFSDSTSPLDALALANPVPPDATYVHPDLEALITRITTSAPKKASSTPRLRLRMFGGLGLGATLAAGIIATLTALVPTAASLTTLSFAASKSAQVTASGSVDVPLLRPLNYTFTLSSPLPEATSQAAVTQITAPLSPVGTLHAVATALDVTIPTAVSTDSGATYSAVGPLYTGTLSTTSGFDSWTISSAQSAVSPASPTAPVTPSVPSQPITQAPLSQLVARSETFLAALGVQTSTPVASPEDSTPGSPVSVNATLTLNSQPTNVTFNFVFASNGALQSASGAAFVLGASNTYPLISPDGGVSQIGVQSATMRSMVYPGRATFAFYGVAHPSSTPTSLTSTSLSPAEPPLTPAPVIPVSLTGYSSGYGLFNLHNGDTYFIPLYNYSGDTQVATPYSVSFSIVAVSPTYIRLP